MSTYRLLLAREGRLYHRPIHLQATEQQAAMDEAEQMVYDMDEAGTFPEGCEALLRGPAEGIRGPIDTMWMLASEWEELTDDCEDGDDLERQEPVNG